MKSSWPVLVLMLYPLYWMVHGLEAKRVTRAVFIQVGQGDATLIQSVGFNLLVDSGPSRGDFSAGERLVAPALRKAGVDKLEYLVLTHPDSDHTGGAEAILQRYKVDTLVLSKRFYGHEDLAEILELARTKGSRVIWVSGKISLKLEHLIIEVIAPNSNSREDNANSLVVDVQGKQRLLLTADLGMLEEEALAESGDWDADVINAGHHGSGESLSIKWIKETSPQSVVISSGAWNPYGHPNPEAIHRLGNAGIGYFRLDQTGSLQMNLDSEVTQMTRF